MVRPSQSSQQLVVEANDRDITTTFQEKFQIMFLEAGKGPGFLPISLENGESGTQENWVLSTKEQEGARCFHKGS